MKRLVVDASVAVKWVLPEDDSERAEVLVLRNDVLLHAPAFLFMEAANVFWAKARGGQLDSSQAPDRLSRLRRAPLLVWDGDEPLPRALDLARSLDHAVYDCAYLALALHLDAVYITADRRFWNKAQRIDELRDRVLLLQEAVERL